MYSKGYQAADKDHQTAYATNQTSEEYYRKCVSEFTIEDALSCYKDAYNTDREQERAEDDLDAQREMANWAEGMLWATIFIGSVTAAVTALGVWFVAKTLSASNRTLDATRAMATDQKRIGDAQVAASNAAVDAAHAANQVAAEQFRAGFKPWISVDVKGPFIDMGGENPIRNFAEGETQRMVLLNAQTFITCIGEIPVTVEDFELLLAEGEDWPYVINPTAGWDAKSEDFFTILPSKSAIQICQRTGISGHSVPFNQIILTPENRSQFMENPPPIIGKVIYSDPMGVRYEHNFAFVAKLTWDDSFKRWGGRERNYEREIN